MIKKQKRCWCCKMWLELDQFGKDSSSFDGLYSRCRSCCKKYMAEYFRQNKTVLLKQTRRNYKRNRIRILKQQSDYGKKTRKTRSIKDREYRRSHKHVGKAAGARRRSRIKKAGNLPTERVVKVIEASIKKYGVLTCYLCYKAIEHNKWTLEHKIPLSRGGTNEYRNLGVAHTYCNSSKNNKTEKEYREMLKKNKKL